MPDHVDIRKTPAAGGLLRRYERPLEVESPQGQTSGPIIPFAAAASVLAGSLLSPGSVALLLGLLRTGTTKVFPGGGIGIEYGSLLKTAVRPDYLAAHVEEVADHLRGLSVDLLLVPGMSGYPVGAMYSCSSRIPAILLKKGRLLPGDDVGGFPEGSFVIPSYTGDGDVVMSVDLDAVEDIVNAIVHRQIREQGKNEQITVAIRCAGADDIIDKATMAQAITESAPLFCERAVATSIARYRETSGDQRAITTSVSVVTWVTPLIKSYNRPHEHLENRFGITPMAGVEISSVQLDPPAIGVVDVGCFAFANR